MSQVHKKTGYFCFSYLKKSALAIVFLAACSANNGCTTLSSDLPGELAANGEAPGGVAYSLPMYVMDFALSVNPKTAQFSVKPSQPRAIAAPGHRYYLRYHPLPNYEDVIKVSVSGQSFLQSVSSNTTDRSADIRISSSWRAGSQSIVFDYGLVFLPDKALFSPCGILPLDAPENDFFNKQAAERAQSFFVAGFPNDPKLDQDKQFGTMWFGRGGLRGAGINSVRHLVDTTPGQSGAPLFIIGKSRANGQNIPLVLAIHSRPPVAGREYNISRRIDKQVLDDVSRWLGEFGYSQEKNPIFSFATQ